MTLEQLQAIFLGASLETWHQHENGNGWVKNTAKVDKTAFVGENALVFDDARVCGNARVYDNAVVYGNTRVCGNAWVSGNAQVYGNAVVYGNARVSGDALVYGNAWVYGNARVSSLSVINSGKYTKSPIQIQGSKFFVNENGDNIQIGCQCMSIEDWEAEGLYIAKNEGFTDKDMN